MAKTEIKVINESSMYRCSKCGRSEMQPTNFYKTNSMIFNNHGYMSLCKDCLAKQYNTYLISFRDIPKAIKRVCMAVDMYYCESVVESLLKKQQATTVPIGNYVKSLNMSQHRGKTFDNTIDECFLFDLEYDPNPKSDENEEFNKPITTIPETVRTRWGSGFTDDEYKILEEHYRYLKKANTDFDSNQEIFIMDLCQIKMQQIRAMKSGRTDDYIKLTDSYRKTFSQAGLKTTQDSSASNDEAWGEWMGIISKYTPEEYYKDKDLYSNFGNIEDYFNRFLLRPLRNLQYGTNERDKEYFVSEE